MEPNNVQLRVPVEDVLDPEITVVIPALNEEINIEEFIAWTMQGLRELPVTGEVLIVDSSTDKTPEISLSCGARVLSVPKRGLGRAYIDAVPFIRGRLVIMGDADCTYDFRNLKLFYDAYRSGATFIMGSRFKGTIEKGAMPFHHRYLGTPITTWVLNRLFKSKFSDIHCGMRAVTTDFLRRMNLQSQSWEYASEMVIKSVTMEAKIAEVPVTFYRDRNGRESHHKRQGWTSPYRAAWSNLQAMFTYGLDFFMIKPGLVLLLIGSLLVFSQLKGPLEIGKIGLSQNWQVLGMFLFLIGLNLFLLGRNMRNLIRRSNYSNNSVQLFPTFNKVVITAVSLGIAGMAFILPVLREYVSADFAINESVPNAHTRIVTGLSLVATGFTIFVHSLVDRAIRSTLNDRIWHGNFMEDRVQLDSTKNAN